MSNGQQANCILEVCCDAASAVKALESDMVTHGCATPADCAAYVLHHYTLAPASFRKVKNEIAKLAREN